MTPTVTGLVELLPIEAWIVGFVAVNTGVVVIEKLTDEAPAGTVTVAGTPAEVELLDRLTATPPVGAAALRVTVPSAVSPPTIAVGFAVIAVT